MSLWHQVRKLLEMIRFSHTLFALPFALLAAVMAWTVPTKSGDMVPFRWTHLLGILICMVAARSAAMAFNRLADHRIDAANPRTQQRHLPSGSLSRQSVLMFTTISAVVFVAATTLFLPNWLPLFLALPVLAVLLGYSFTKRFTSLAHFWLGLALMLAPVATWIALRGEAVMSDWTDLAPAVVLGLAVMFWVAGFDIIYACQDYAFDRQSKLKSIPVWLGVEGALRFAAFCHLMMILLLILLPLLHRWIGPPLELGWVYWLGLAAVAALLVYEHGLVTARDLSRVNVAFFNVNAIVSFGLFVVVTIDLLVI